MTADPAPAALPFIERGSDWLNPILVKETRQALKSRQFVATFFLMLIASWMISVFGVVISGATIAYQEMGRQFFAFYYVVLAIAIFVVVPFSAFRSLVSERDLHTWEVLSITTLKPRQIVWGKLTSAVVQLFIYYSAITPFIAFANLLKGIDVPTIAFVLVGSMFWSLALSMLALALGTFGNQRHWQVFLTLAVLGGLLMGMSMSIGVAFQGVDFRFPFDDPEFWWIVAVVVSYGGAYCLLFLQIAVAQLTFDADNRSSGIRLAGAGIFWMSLAWIGGLAAFGGVWGLPTLSTLNHDEFLAMFTTCAGLHWFVFGLFATTESDVLSRRVRRDLSRFGAWRVAMAPFIPGGSRGLVYVIAHLSILAAAVVGIWMYGARADTKIVAFAIGVWCYIIIYLGFGAALGRAARALSGDFRPSHTRVLTVLILAVGSILPLTLYFFESVRNSPRAALFVTDPFQTLYRLGEGHVDSNLLLVILLAGALLSIAVNLRAMLTGVIDVTRAYVPHAPALPRVVNQPTAAS